MKVTCPVCSHAAEFDGDASAEVIQCDECKTRIAFGIPMPNIAAAEHPKDQRFVALRFDFVQDGQPGAVTFTVDRQLGGLLARKLLGLCP